MDSNRPLRRVAALRAMAGLVLAAFVSIAAAQPKPALVRDLDEPGRDPFMVTVDAVVGSDDCHQGGSTTNCSVFLGSVPAGKRLVITYASAVFFLDDETATNPWVELTMGAGRRVSLPLPQARGIQAIAASPVMAFADPGPTIQMQVRASALRNATSVIASIAGYFIAVP